MCVKPIWVRNSPDRNHGHDSARLQVPCGKCPLCVKAKLQAWLFRLDYEARQSTNPLFITLTYNNENLPFDDKGNRSLYKRDVQLFLKRLRKSHAKISSTPLVYYCVGEYGTLRGRPHYHMLLFNLADNKQIDKAWGLGHVDVQTPRTNNGSFLYVLKYISKPRKKAFVFLSSRLCLKESALTTLHPKCRNFTIENWKIATSSTMAIKNLCRNTSRRSSTRIKTIVQWLRTIFNGE